VRRSLVEELRAAFFQWLSLPNYDTVEIVAATIIANRLPGEPLWLAIVGPSASGKTEIVRAMNGMDNVHMVDKIGPATWVSGFKPGEKTRRRKRPNGSSGPGEVAHYGLLSKMMDGKPHIAVVEDFSIVLGKRRELKGEVFSDLRKLYDGEFKADFGNGVVMDWKGKLGMIVCSTGTYDDQVQDLAAFGERFTVWRPPAGDQILVAQRSGRNSENTKQMRAELGIAMAKLDRFRLPTGSVNLSLDARTLVSQLTAFVALCRTVVPRDPYKRDIITIPEPEGTGRLSAQLHQLLRGLVILYEHSEVTPREIELVQRTAFSTIPTIRRRVIEKINPKSGATLTELIKSTKIPKPVLQRALEEMKLLEIIEWMEPKRGVARSGLWVPKDEWKVFFHYVREADITN
jgi:energy-coupling factor transporter ATP-binding protein EcfA2